jgi:hypothetical protein
MWPGAAVEWSIFGTDDAEAIWREVLDLCPDAVDCFAFEVSVGALFGLRLGDGSRIALKIHREHDADSLEALQRVQAHLYEEGFPCPQPLGVRGRATLEHWCDEGVYRDAHDPAVAFLHDYERERNRPFSPEEQGAARAAAVYSRAYAARCTHAIGKNARQMWLEEYADAFL